MKPLVTPHFFGIGLQSQNFVEFDIRFLAVEGSTLDANISSSVRILFSMYLLILKVF